MTVTRSDCPLGAVGRGLCGYRAQRLAALSASVRPAAGTARLDDDGHALDLHGPANAALALRVSFAHASLCSHRMHRVRQRNWHTPLQRSGSGADGRIHICIPLKPVALAVREASQQEVFHQEMPALPMGVKRNIHRRKHTKPCRSHAIRLLYKPVGTHPRRVRPGGQVGQESRRVISTTQGIHSRLCRQKDRQE